MRIYITHCSARKSPSAKRSGAKVSPDKLYASKRIQSFMRRCKEQGVKWAIFSDRYGIYFPNERHPWYEKSPDSVTPTEFSALLKNFHKRLRIYDEVWFYRHPARFHKLYRRLLRKARMKHKVRLFGRVNLIHEHSGLLVRGE